MLSKSPSQLQEMAQQSAKHHTLDPERSSARCLPSMQKEVAEKVEVTGLKDAGGMALKLAQSELYTPHLFEAVLLEEGVQTSTFLGQKVLAHLPGQSPVAATRDATTELLSWLTFTSKSSGFQGGG